jgi:hypothetical protein
VRRRGEGGESKGWGEYVKNIEILTNIVALQDKDMKKRSIVTIVAQRHQIRG